MCHFLFCFVFPLCFRTHHWNSFDDKKHRRFIFMMTNRFVEEGVITAFTFWQIWGTAAMLVASSSLLDTAIEHRSLLFVGGEGGEKATYECFHKIPSPTNILYPTLLSGIVSRYFFYELTFTHVWWSSIICERACLLCWKSTRLFTHWWNTKILFRESFWISLGFFLLPAALNKSTES